MEERNITSSGISGSYEANSNETHLLECHVSVESSASVHRLPRERLDRQTRHVQEREAQRQSDLPRTRHALLERHTAPKFKINQFNQIIFVYPSFHLINFYVFIIISVRCKKRKIIHLLLCNFYSDVVLLNIKN